MGAQSAASLNDLFPEIFPVIASFLPLHATPSTLLYLAFVNKRISNIVLPLLCSCLILKNENDALKTIQKLLDEPELGKAVRELHILSDLSLATRAGENAFDVVRGLEKVITAGSLPYIHTLGLSLLYGWHYDDDALQPVEGFGQLQSGFWTGLRKNCPRLRGLVLRNTGEREDDPGLLEIQGITSLKLCFKAFSLHEEGMEKLLKNSIAPLCGSLHTLDLASNSPDLAHVAPLFSLHFPHLRSLSLISFILNDADEAMAFWQQHSSLEYLKIVTNGMTPWFGSELLGNFLPKLKCLKARFSDVLILAPILNQLVGLTVYQSINAQIPYLLRAVLPEGLPNLKSLNIEQYSSASGKFVNIEGSRWYETKDGRFMQAEKAHEALRSVSGGYIHSIARGAPNLEEIGFFSHIPEFTEIASDIAGLSKLRRFYHCGNNVSLSDITDEEREFFISDAQVLAEACSELTAVVDTSNDNPPFVAARIYRDETREIVKIDLRTWFGMHIGNEDEAFPPYH